MSDIEPPPLPSDVKDLLGVARAPLPPGGFEAQVLARVRSTLGAPAAVAAAPAAAASKMGAWGVKVSLATLLLGAAVGTAVGSRFLAAAPALPAPAPPVVIAAAPPQAAAPAEAAPVPVVVAPVKKPVVRDVAPAPRPTRDVDLAEERALVEIARTSLARRENTRALEALGEHARRFPSGQLGEERDSLWVQVLVNLGDYPQARRRAAEFRTRYPESMLAASVDAAVQSIPK